MIAKSQAMRIVSLCLAVCLVDCDDTSAAGVRNRAEPGQSAAVRTVPVLDSAVLAAELATAIRGERPSHLRSDEWKTVARLYRSANPLWIARGAPAQRALDLADVLDSAESLGLRSSDYAARDVKAALHAAASSPDEKDRSRLFARADVMLTGSFVAITDDLLTGRVDPRKVEPSWHIRERTFDLRTRVEAAVDSLRSGRRLSDVVAGLRPDYGSYGALLGALAQYRALEKRGSWQRISAGPPLKLGDTGNRVDEVRRRLAAEKFLSSAAGSDTFDVRMAGAIAEFQRMHGLSADSILGPATRTALDVPAARRVRQIEANLERMRWLPTNPGERFIVVNVPAFVLYAFDGRERVVTMRVVVGDELVSRRTPIFADTLEFIQFGPYWNVPRSIAVNEILPQARRDRGYLARNNYEILRGWGDNAPVVNPRNLTNAQLSSSRYRIRQKPGPTNALGRVKFMFPNDYAVYLHDTPAQARFADTNRAISHGCVRVANPKALADYVLRDRQDWPPDRIGATLSEGRRVRVNLKKGPAVYLVYLTAFGREREIFFRDDIYDRDDRLVRALSAADAIPRGSRSAP